MNYSIISGILAVEPRLTFCAGIRDRDGKQLIMCRTRIEVERYSDGVNVNEELMTKDSFAITAFGKKAERLATNFQKGSWLMLFGKFRNYDYTDANGTRHYTNFFLVNQLESNIELLSSNLNLKEQNHANKNRQNETADDVYVQNILSKGISLINERDLE